MYVWNVKYTLPKFEKIRTKWKHRKQIKIIFVSCFIFFRGNAKPGSFVSLYARKVIIACGSYLRVSFFNLIDVLRRQLAVTVNADLKSNLKSFLSPILIFGQCYTIDHSFIIYKAIFKWNFDCKLMQSYCFF